MLLSRFRAVAPGVGPREALARVLTEVFAPAPVCAVLLITVAAKSSPTATDALKWGGLAACFTSVLPTLLLLGGVRRRRLSDRHVGRREQRPAVLAAVIALVLLGTCLLVALGAPRDIVALIVAMSVGLGVSLAITLFWKISVHAATTAGASIVLLLVFGPSALPAILVPLLVSWARVELRDHTPAQALAGLGMGAAVAALVFLLLRA